MTLWSGVATPVQEKGCKPPFSFYFDLIDGLWKDKRFAPQPLHRLCTLARKQGANFLTIEDALSDPVVIEEIDALDIANGSGGSAEAVTVAFFATQVEHPTSKTVADEELVGALTLINYRKAGDPDFSCSYVYEAVFRRPAITDLGMVRPLLNNFIFPSFPFDVKIRGRMLAVQGTYFSQQNFHTYRCAQANLRMALNTISPSRPFVSAIDINKASQTTTPSSGLTISQITSAIDCLSTTVGAFTVPCAGMPPDQFATLASAFAESGILALIVFSTSFGTDQHVVTSCGYTLNTDEWHPHGLAAYSGHSSAPFHTSALWTDHLVIHDDNFGPYYTLTLSNRALEMSPTVKAQWLVALAPKGLTTNPIAAQAWAAIGVQIAIQILNGNCQWFEFLKKGMKLVHRVTLVRRVEYIAHLETPCHNGTVLTADNIKLMEGLPDFFWMVEFSTVEMFTGNHSKLGEVIIDAQQANFSTPWSLILSVRLPGCVGVPQTVPGTFIEHEVSADSHMPIYRKVDHTARW